MEKERLAYLDQMKGVAIFLMVIPVLSPSLLQQGGRDKHSIWKRMCPVFHLPGAVLVGHLYVEQFLYPRFDSMGYRLSLC